MKRDKKKPKHKKEQVVELSQDRVHRPRVPHPHVAQEYRDRSGPEVAESLTRGLMPHLRGRTQGLPDDAYKHPGWHSSQRRDIFAIKEG